MYSINGAAGDALEYYEALIDYLDDTIPNLQVLIAQFERQYYGEMKDD